MPLPVFVAYRIIWFLYILAWLIATLVNFAPPDREGPRWLIFLTNQSYILLVVSTGAITILTVGYAIIYLIDKQILQSFHPQSASTLQAIYMQDNIGWYVKICWLLYIMGAALALVVVVGYWSIVYDPNCESSTSPNSTIICLEANEYSFHLHLVNGVLIILDLYLSRVPYQLFHIFYPSVFMLGWVIFSAIYFAAGGTNPLDEGPYIYELLDYGNNPGRAVGLAIVLIVSPTAAFIVLFFLGWIRDVIYQKIPCCYRQLHNSQESSPELELFYHKSS